jgi:hypothetical protein
VPVFGLLFAFSLTIFQIQAVESNILGMRPDLESIENV